jgi:hypothetical protein
VPKENTIFVKYVNIKTDCIGSRNTSCRGTGLKVTKSRKVKKSLMDLEGIRKLIESKMEGQSMLPLNALIRKSASRCLLLKWRGRKFNLAKMSSYLYVLSLLKNLVQQCAVNFHWILSSLAESVEVIEFQTTDAYSSLDRTSELYKTKRLSRVEKEDVMYRIKPNIFKPCESTQSTCW